MENTLLNLVPASYLPEVHLSQYDIGRELKFTLKDGSSDYTVPSGAVVTVKATKPSGLGFEVACTFNGGVVTLVTTETMTPENGRFPAELSIVSGNTVIGTSNFIFNIERSPHPEGTIDGDAESLLPELTLLVERIEAAADSVDEDTQIVTEAKGEVLQAKADTLQAKADTEQIKEDTLAIYTEGNTYLGDKADAIVKTASGEIASFTDGGDDLPMKSLKVNIVPKQSGSGDTSPSNVRPISGTDAVGIFDTGINIWDEEWVAPNGYVRSKNYIPVRPNTQYYWKFSVQPGNGFSFLDLNKNRIGSTIYSFSSTNNVITTPENCYFVAFGLGSAYGTTYNYDSGINYPATDHEYHPYEGESKSIPLGQTVYGGVLDVVSGKLSITKALRNLGTDQSGSWYMASTSVSGKQRLAIQIPAIKVPDTVAICNLFKTVSGNDVYNGVEGIGTDRNDRLLFYKSDLQTVADWKSWATTNNLTVVYELATPIEIQLTPTEVKTLLGANNIWSDSGSVEVEYRADTTLAYNELLAMILENIGN